MKSPLIHSFSQGCFVLTVRQRGRKREREGDQDVVVGVWRAWGEAGEVVARGVGCDQSSPVLHVGGSERLSSAKLDKKRGAH